jgi:LmbE family N-acetylglucosaminyl deacetylase
MSLPFGEALRGRVVVLSPHLDDGVFSLGATIAQVRREGSEVELLTVFACDPDSRAPANEWDTRGGFTTEGEAARNRREEDREACRFVGAQPYWLPFRGGGYTQLKDEEAIYAAIAAHVEGANAVLMPGFPLRNDDHAWLAALIERRNLPVQRLGRYLEQPYGYVVRKEHPVPRDSWERNRAPLRERLRKRRAVQAYASQLPMLSLGRRKLNHLLLQREAISWDSP